MVQVWLNCMAQLRVQGLARTLGLQTGVKLTAARSPEACCQLVSRRRHKRGSVSTLVFASTAAAVVATRPTRSRVSATQSRVCVSATMPEDQEQSVPGSFRRMVAKKAGESVRAVATIKQETTPEPGEGEVLIKVISAGINGGCETFRARGERAFAGLQNASDFALGSEGAGVVLRVGEGTSLQVGDAVAFVGSAFAELNIVKAASCHRFGRAEDLTAKHFREATALRISGLTALVALELTGEIKQHQTILITAAAGGTGHLAVQIAKLNGARVIATCSTEDKAKVLHDLGADRVVVYTKEDLSQVLATELPEGLDLAYEGVGGQLHTTALEHLKEGGRQLQVGYISHYPEAAGQDADADQGNSLGDASWGGKTWNLPGNKTVYFN